MAENERHTVPEGSIRTMHSDEDHLHKKAMVIPEVDTDVLVDKKNIPQRGDVPKKHGDNVFDVSSAFKGESELGTFVTDKKHKKRSIFGVIRDATKQWTDDKVDTVKSIEAFQKPVVPTIAPGTKRKHVIEKAITNLDQLPRDDHKVVIERIKTFQNDAERVTGKPFYIKPKEERTKQAGWSHVVGNEPAKPSMSSPQGTILSDAAKAQQIRREAITPEEHERGAAPQVEERINAPLEAYIQQKPVDPREINRAEVMPDKEAQGALPNTDKRTELNTFEEPLVTPKESTIDARIAAFTRQSETKVQTRTPVVTREEPREMAARPEPKRLVFVAIVSVGVIVLSLGGVSMWYMVKERTATPGLVATPDAAPIELISADVTTTIQLPDDRTTLLEDLRTAISGQRARLTHISIVKEQNGERLPASTAEFFNILAPRTPSSFVRSLGTVMMTGGIGLESPEPYFIFTTSSFDSAFAGMLDWEPYVSADLAPFFGSAVSRSLDEDARTGDRTGEARFVDRSISGTNVRVLSDETGSVRLVYGFVENNSVLIITTSETAFTELRGRF